MNSVLPGNPARSRQLDRKPILILVILGTLALMILPLAEPPYSYNVTAGDTYDTLETNTTPHKNSQLPGNDTYQRSL